MIDQTFIKQHSLGPKNPELDDLHAVGALVAAKHGLEVTVGLLRKYSGSACRTGAIPQHRRAAFLADCADLLARAAA